MHAFDAVFPVVLHLMNVIPAGSFTTRVVDGATRNAVLGKAPKGMPAALAP